VLTDMPRFTLLSAMTVFRAAYNHSAGEGIAVSEMPNRDGKACPEISFVHDAVYGA